MLKVDIKKISLIDKINSKTIVQDISFDLNPGKIFTILGKNGSGKSTLIKSLTMLLDVRVYSTQGSAFWNGENIFLMNNERLLNLRKKEIRYVLQDLTNNFDPLKKLKYYFDKTGFSIVQISAQLKSFLLPDYDLISKLHSYEISGGMAQRLSLLLALLPKPKLIILDEPTSAVDYTNINLIKLKLKEFVTTESFVLIVTQDIAFAKEVSDEIAFLQNGKLSEFDSTDSFFNPTDENIHAGFLKSYHELE